MNLFDRFHAAFEEAPPRGAFERLQRDLIKHSAAGGRRRPAFHMRWSRMTFRLVAAAAAAVILIALVAAYMAGQHMILGETPAGSSGSVAAYQGMVADDYHAFVIAPFDCQTVNGPTCVSDVAANRAAVQKWLDDMRRFSTPPQFAVVDAQMRVHIRDMLQKIDDAAAALAAKDQTRFDSALNYGQADIDWLDQVTNGVANSRGASATDYTNFLKTENDILFGGSGRSDTTACTSVDDALCLTEVKSSMHGLGLLFSDLARNIPPSSLADKASTLGQDLAQADNEYLKMNNAMYQKDLPALRAGNAAAQDAWIAVASDLQT